MMIAEHSIALHSFGGAVAARAALSGCAAPSSEETEGSDVIADDIEER